MSGVGGPCHKDRISHRKANNTTRDQLSRRLAFARSRSGRLVDLHASAGEGKIIGEWNSTDIAGTLHKECRV